MKYFHYLFFAALCLIGVSAASGQKNQAESSGEVSVINNLASTSEGPAQTAYVPAKGRGPAIIVISGASGSKNPSYRSYAFELARLGYYSILLDGNDILRKDKKGAENLKMALERAQRSPHAIPGKTAVIGFSLGGGAALRIAANMPQHVSVVVAYYPFTSFAAGPASLVQYFRVPILVMAGGRDDYKKCCMIESARAIEAVAKESGAKFELVVYPEANHDFNQEEGHNYRRDDTNDAWRRTVEMLRRYQPLP